jgi:hypothetical protein
LETRTDNDEGGNRSFAIASPRVELPKGGGAIRGIGEKFAANPVSGTGSMSVPIATSPGRSGFDPQLSLSYDSGAGNGPFGFGWSLSLPSITQSAIRRARSCVLKADRHHPAGLGKLFPQDPDQQLWGAIGAVFGSWMNQRAITYRRLHKAVIAKMKELPTEDRLMGKGYVRIDGRKIHPMYLFEVKRPEESKAPWDYYKQLATIPAEEAWRPLDQSECPLVKK